MAHLVALRDGVCCVTRRIFIKIGGGGGRGEGKGREWKGGEGRGGGRERLWLSRRLKRNPVGRARME